MARMLSEFFTPKAISCTAFYKKFPKGPFKVKIEGVELQEVKKGGERVLALHIMPNDVWIACNQTNATELAKKFGADVDDWIGKKLALDRQETGYQGKLGFKLTPA